MSEYDDMSVAGLKAELKEAGLPVSGKKAELVARLKESSSASEEITEVATEEVAMSSDDIESEEKESIKDDDISDKKGVTYSGGGFIVFIRHADSVLLLKRSDEVSDFNSMWDGVYGVGDPSDINHVLTRVEDATAIPTESLTFVRMGEPRGIEFGNRLNDVTPILVVSNTNVVEPKSLYNEAIWVDPGFVNVLSPDEVEGADDVSVMQERPSVSQLGEMYGDVAAFLFMLKTTIGQKQKIANEIRARLSGSGSLQDIQDEVFSVIHPRMMRGYIFIEATAKHHVEKLIGRAGGVTTPMRGAAKVLPGEAPFHVVSNYLEPKSATAGIEVGSIVEIRVGHFKGNRARVTAVAEGKEEVTVELFEAAVPIPITMRADNVRVTERVV